MRTISFILAWGLLMLVAASAMAQQPSLVSINKLRTGTGNTESLLNILYHGTSSLSADGRFVVFQSRAKTLVANDNNADVPDIFVRDTVAGKTTLVSVNTAGNGSGNGHSFNPIISADGRFVVFSSRASNLVANDNNGPNIEDLFVRDLRLGKTTLVTVNTSGNSPNGHSYNPMISADGRYVAFSSTASDLVNNDVNGFYFDVFVRDLRTSTTVLVSVNNTGAAAGNHDSIVGAMTPDGRFVAFTSWANDLVPSDTNGFEDVFLRDLVTGKTTPVSVNKNGVVGNNQSYYPALSNDGQRVAFISLATNLAPPDTNEFRDVYVRDVGANTTTLVSINRTANNGGNDDSANSFSGYVAPLISADGKFVTFISLANNLVANDTNGPFGFDVFVRDLAAKKTILASVNMAGTGSSNAGSYAPTMSADGRYVAFTSCGDNLVGNDFNNSCDIFFRDIKGGRATLVSVNLDGLSSGNHDSSNSAISADGRVVAFNSMADDLAANDRNGNLDVFVSRIFAGNLQFSASGYRVNESSGEATVTVKRTGGSEGAVAVKYATSNVTATAGKDYTARTGSLSFANGETIKTFTVPIVEDALNEGDETFQLTLSSPKGGAGLGIWSTAALTITDNDPRPTISMSDVSVTESDSGTVNANFIVSLSAASAKGVTVNYTTANRTAVATNDYQATSGGVSFNPGQISLTIAVQVKGDTLPETNETFKLNLRAPTNATIADGSGIGTIINND